MGSIIVLRPKDNGYFDLLANMIPHLSYKPHVTEAPRA